MEAFRGKGTLKIAEDISHLGSVVIHPVTRREPALGRTAYVTGGRKIRTSLLLGRNNMES